jgi:diaminopimelate decarboxylase
MSFTPDPKDLLPLAKAHGTPLYVYRADSIRDQVASLREAFQELPATFFYACKALTNVHVLRYMHGLGCHIDCSSINEVRLALLAGFRPEQVLYTSNGIAFTEIEAAADQGVHINIDSLSNLEKFGKRYGARYPVGIRIRPNILAGGNLKISTGHASSKFGIPVEQLPAVHRLRQDYGLQIHVLHVHTGSDIKDPDVFIQGIQVLFDLVPQFPDLKALDLGGGFKVPYRPQETGTDLPELCKKLRQALVHRPEAAHLQLWFEPGKFLVSSCGYLLAQVTVLKDAGQTVFASVDTGFNHLIRPMFYDAYHHVVNLSNPAGPVRTYTITGNICETDTFAADRDVAELREGDILAFCNAGAYGYEMASNYNARLRPAEVFITGQGPKLIRRRDTLEDLLRNQSC